MGIRSNNPAPHAGEKEAAAIPEDGDTPAMGRPPQDSEDHPKPRHPGVPIPSADVEPAPEGQLPKPDMFKEGFPR